MTGDNDQGRGRWRYAVRETDEDGDVVIWSSYSIYTNEPFWSSEDAREFAEPWLENFEVIRTWVPEPVWEKVGTCEAVGCDNRAIGERDIGEDGDSDMRSLCGDHF